MPGSELALVGAWPRAKRTVTVERPITKLAMAGSSRARATRAPPTKLACVFWRTRIPSPLLPRMPLPAIASSPDSVRVWPVPTAKVVVVR